MAAFMTTCGREMTLPLRTKTLRVSACYQQFRGYARRFRRHPVRLLTADEEKNEFIDKKVAFGDRIRDFDRRDPVLNNLPQSKDLDRLQSLPKIRKAAVDIGNFQNEAKSKGYTNNKKGFNYNKNANYKQTIDSKRNISYAKKQHPVEHKVSFGVKYANLESENKKVSILMRDAKSKKFRDQDRIILLEGSTLICDALQAGGKPKSVYFSQFDALKRLPAEHLEEVPVYKCEQSYMNRWSDMDTTPDVIALFHMPEDGKLSFNYEATIPLTIILDRIRDPGNMGTLIRSAAAVGCQRVIAMADCVDIWIPKVIRAGSGSLFRVPLHRNITWKHVENYIPVGARVYLSDKRRPTDKRVAKYTDPDDEDIDSLGYNQDDYESDPESDQVMNTSFNNSQLLKKYQHAPLPVSNFSDVNFSRNDHTVLVIGGETRGISLEARKLAYDMYGHCVVIPMTNGVESLNAAVAGSVVMFEVHKQLSMQTNKQARVAANEERGTNESVNKPTGVSSSADGVTVELVNKPTGVSSSADGVTVESVNKPTGVSASADGVTVESLSKPTGVSE